MVEMRLDNRSGKSWGRQQDQQERPSKRVAQVAAPSLPLICSFAPGRD